jgi:hypothetical protein
MAISAMRFCLRSQNQYAHCAWWNDNSGKLAFANLEDIAKGNAFLNDLVTLPTHHVDVAILMIRKIILFTWTDFFQH